MKILVAGATGIIGRQLLPMIREHGFELVALGHSSEGQNWLVERQYAYVDCDVFDPVSVKRVFEAVKPDAVINQLTSIPPNLNPRHLRTQMATTNRLRSLATDLLVQAASKVDTRRVISQSIAFAYAPRPGPAATESDTLFDHAPSGFDQAVAAIRACESVTLDTPGINGTVLRYGHFCGPESAYAPGGATHDAVAAGRFPEVGRSTGCFSFVHVRDAARATIRALTADKNGVYNIVDNTPVPVSEWLPWYASRLEAKKPARVPGWVARLLVGRFAEHMMVSQVGADNQRALQDLNWLPEYPTWKEGLLASL
ncbi:MAG: NAD(P)-dependent oxidoreductase [Xanthomonadales bacterium]|nr:NAD(P)-dependent oxidoreductase [Xanthomonadales bacterium]